MCRWQKTTVITATVVFLILFAAAIILPEIIRDKAIEQVRNDYNRELKIERIIINLFNLQVDIRKLDLKEPGSERTFVSFDRLIFSLSLRSLYDKALIIDDLILDHPFIQLEKTGPDSFNFSDFIPEAAPQKEPAEESSSPFFFSFNNLQIKEGNLIFSDTSDKVDLIHHINNLNLSVPFIGNIPYLVERYVQPSISLQIDGSPLSASGQMKPFDQSVETQLNLNLNGVDLPFYAAYLQPFLPFELVDGSLSTQLEISYRVSLTQEPKLLIGGDLTLSALRLEQQGKPLFFMPLLLVQLDWANPFANEYHFSNISIYDPLLTVERDPDGKINLLALAPEQKSPKQPEDIEKEPGKLPRLTIDTLRLREGRVDFTDAVSTGGFESRIFDINLLTKELSTVDETPASLNFGLKTSHNEKADLQGKLRLDPLLFEGAFNLQSVPIGDYAPYMNPYLNQTPTGSISLKTDLRITAEEQAFNQLSFKLADLRQAFSDKDVFQLKEFLVTGGEILLPQQQVDIAQISLTGGDLNFERNSAGELPFNQLLKQQTTPEAEPVPETPQDPSAPWQVRLKEFRIDDFNSTFTDGAAPKPKPVQLKNFYLKLADIHWPEAGSSHWTFAGVWGAGGTLAGEGQLQHTPLTAKGKLNIDQFDVTPFNSYIPEQIKLTLTSAKFDSALDFSLAQKEEFTGKLTGTLGLRNLSVTGINEELLSWESLQIDGLEADLYPQSLAISQVSLNNYLAKIRVNNDGTVNLNQITEETDTAEETKAAEVVASPPPETPTQSSPLPPIRIDEITLQGGEVSFIDRHLPKIFSSTMHDLGGRISGLTSEPGKYASVDLRGDLEKKSPLTINGKIAPLAGDLDTELKIRFTNIDLAPASPYSGTYLGYAIDKGKLYLDLDYKIAHRQITASNKLFLDQFTFGDSVESEEATGLPVRLAIALLKDGRGEIHLNLPVSGDTDDPEFGIFSTVMTLLRNLLVKAATAPFSLLASMFGGGDDFSQIGFAPGVADLGTGEQEKLDKLAQMLSERPALNLEISAFIDPETDPEGYRRDQLNRWVQTEWQKRSKPQPEQLITPDEYLENLGRVYSRAKFPKPRNAIGMQKKIPSVEMEKLLLANILVGEEELGQLAKRREAAVQKELIRIDPELKPRIFLKNAEITKPPEKGQNPARVEFGIAAD